MKNRDRNKNIISGVVVVFIIVYAIISTLKVAQLGIDPEDVETVGATLGVASLLPTILAVFLAFMYKDVLISLSAGMLLGGLMKAGIHGHMFISFIPTSCEGIVDTISDRGNASILALCLAVGGMIEIIRMSGGFSNLASLLTRKIDTPKKANIITEVLGILVFFDDYANTLIVGPVMQPITDKLKISREKLAYIVDSTAAPVTGIALISSWVAVEVGVINEGLSNANFDMSGYSLFLKSIPFCFYCIFCLIFIFISSLTEKEFGPMYEAECRARSGIVKKDSEEETIQESNQKNGAWWVAVIPIVVLFIFSLYEFIAMGRANALANGVITGNEKFSLDYLSTIFGEADTIYIVFVGSVIGAIVAALLGVVSKTFSIKEAFRSFVDGCGQLLETVLMLVIAWTMSGFVSEIGAIHYSVHAISSNVAWWLIPLLIFIVCCVVSFAVGSYGCMFIALPMAIPVAVRMMHLHENIPAQYLALVVGCGIAGSIFGDHCSPITDCTILSSEGSGCNNFDHVKTQLPYAFVTAAVTIVVGILPATFGLSAFIIIPIGVVAFYIILKIFGKEPKEEIIEEGE